MLLTNFHPFWVSAVDRMHFLITIIFCQIGRVCSPVWSHANTLKRGNRKGGHISGSLFVFRTNDPKQNLTILIFHLTVLPCALHNFLGGTKKDKFDWESTKTNFKNGFLKGLSLRLLFEALSKRPLILFEVTCLENKRRPVPVNFSLWWCQSQKVKCHFAKLIVK